MAHSEEITNIIIDLLQESLELKSKGKKGYTNSKIAKDVLGSSSAESSVRRISRTLGNKGCYRGAFGSKPLASGSLASPSSRRGIFKGKRYVFTSAQNNTLIHEGFLNSLINYCDFNEAELVVSSFNYNKGSSTTDKPWFDKRIKGLLCNTPMQVAKDLVFCGEFNISPTAITPLSGLHNYTGGESAIIPHAKMQMESVPTPKFDTPKMMYTTGCITQMNYVQMKAGIKSEWHHIFGALIVEIDDEGDWFVRQLTAKSDTGEFYDLDKHYTPSGVTTGCNIEAINYGDIHAAGLDEKVADISWRKEGLSGKESILDVLKPKYQFLNDVLDSKARNHHNIADPHFLFKMFTDKTDSVKDEIILTANVIKETLRDFSKTIIVESNHNLALTKWLKEQDYRKDPVNAVFFLEMQTAIYKGIQEGKSLPVFEYACNAYTDGMEDVLFLKEDESFRITGNIECGSHGHNGNNGSRGSMMTFLKLGIKHNCGHVHGAGFREGVWYAGISGLLDQGYNKGGSGWNNSHIITYLDGKRSIITIKNGKWKGC